METAPLILLNTRNLYANPFALIIANGPPPLSLSFSWLQGVTILLFAQNAPMALGIAEYGYVMESGQGLNAGPSP